MKHAFFALVALCLFGARLPAAEPLTTLEYRISGTQLKVSPAVLAVPKGIAGSVLVEVDNGDSGATAATEALIRGAHVEAILRGPSFEARRLVSAPNAPLLLPPLNLVGDYQLDQIRLVDSTTGEVRLEANPPSVPVNVFDEVLVSRVTSRPLTLEEIQEKGIVIDEQNFRAVEFEVGFVLDGKTIPVRFPVVSPRFQQSTEIIPAAELDELLTEAALINQQIASTTELPPELQGSQLNIQVQGINFQRVEGNEQDLALQIPPIPALMVIPGNIGFLNQFFSVQIFTENAAPASSGLSVHNITAELVLPPGPDRIPATDYSQPGDDPLRMARVGAEAVVQPLQTILRPGPDQQFGTSDDIGRLHPGESGQAEFLVEGLQEGLHVMDLTLTADLDGLAAGTVRIKGKAAGSVLVRNPRFSMAFNHPRTVRAGEPYEASVTILNTGITPANLVSVTLAEGSLSGGVLESSATVQLGTILPGETATATYRVRAQRTGAISFSNLTTSDDSLVGRFRLGMGVDADRGVALSPDTFAMPDYVNDLPEEVLAAAIRVLGQALSVATAAQLPPGVATVSRGAVTTRVLELAEAGQRLRYGDSLGRVMPDLLLDWQGGRRFDTGFHQILMETGAGREWREAIHQAMAAAAGPGATTRLIEQAPDLAGRGEPWAVFSLDAGSGEIRFGDGLQGSIPASGAANAGAAYRHGDDTTGAWLVARPSTNLVLEWTISSPLAGETDLALLITGTDGTAAQWRWTVADLPVGACVSYDRAAGDLLMVDINCDGVPETSLPAAAESVAELPPRVLGVVQDVSVNAGRPPNPCAVPEMQNYGTVVAVLFSKPMTQQSAGLPDAYRLDNGNSAGSVQIQPGGRVALLNLRQGVSAIRPRTMTVSGVSDPRGNLVTEEALRVATDLRAGIAVQGRVVRSDGSVAAGVPVTLTMYDEVSTLFGCEPYVMRVSQVFTDSTGSFEFDFVMSGLPYSVSATDTAGLSEEALQVLLESISGDQFARDKFLALAGSPAARDTLLEEFAVGALPEAIAKVEGLDRALLRDEILPGSTREGTTVPVALRFRGRATVAGQVLASDGLTPAPGAAVNLFPDPDSRELGRGIFADSQGRFAFSGVPLGIFTVKAETATGQFRTVSGLLDQPGQLTNIVVVLTDASTATTELRGRVVEANQDTPHPYARVFVGRFNGDRLENVVAAVTADANGSWSAPGLPVRFYDVAAVSLDGKRKGERREIATVPNGVVQLSIPLQDVVTVFGRVETSTGQAVPNALVAGGETLVRTDANGLFTLPGVPTGRRSISAGLERNPEAGIDFPRLGSTSATIVAGVENFVVVRLRPAGRIVGRVLDAAGAPVPNVSVVIPRENGFLWVDADAEGEYRFENLSLGNYSLSAPGPAVAQTDTTGLIDQIRQGSESEVLAAIGEAFEIFSGASDPFLTGENEHFNPLTWGYNSASLSFDGQTIVADIQYLRQGTVSGIVRNSQGVPIGARVRLTGLGPLANGQPSTIIRGERNSDPATGVFVFENQLLAGPWGLQAASPFYPVVIATNGVTSEDSPHSLGNVLVFPDVREVNGRLNGFVLLPDGSPAGSNVNVKISFGDDYVIRTDEAGFFDTQIKLPAGGYHVEAEDPATGLVGDASILLKAGLTNSVTVRLLARGHLQVTVLLADGTPVNAASVRLEQGTYPRDQFEGATAADGTARFANLFEGRYAVTAELVSGPTTISGRSGLTLLPGVTNQVTVRLQPTGSIIGKFVKRDRVTPIPFAQVAVGALGFAATDENGAFEVQGIPLGTYNLTGNDPVTGAGARLSVTLATDGEITQVLLVEQARAEVNGYVVDSYGTNFVAGAEVTLRSDDTLWPARTVTTGPDGGFSFAGVPAGGFRLEALDPVTSLRGSRTGTLPEDVATLSVNIPLQPLAAIRAQVFLPGGVVPATNALVKVLTPTGNLVRQSDADVQGLAFFPDLPLGSYLVRAEGLLPTQTRSVAQAGATLDAAGILVESRLELAGVGEVHGTVFLSDGVTPAAGAEVIIENLAPLVQGQTEVALADANGRYTVGNIAVGPFRATATYQALGASFNGGITTSGESVAANLTLGGSGSVTGRLVRADGVTPGSAIDVLLTFDSQSGLPGRATVRTDANGNFLVGNVPLGNFNLEAIATEYNAIARLASSIAANGDTLDLGNIPLDEHDPVVTAVFPAHTAVEVPISVRVELTFSEALQASSITPDGIFLRSGTGSVRSSVELLDDTNGLPRIVRITPDQPLVSEATYEVVVIDDERLSATGSVIARGPRDLVDRPLVVPFISRFTTADNDPPRLLSLTPADAAVQIDPRAVIRLSFNEPIQAQEFTFTLTGPGGPVPGQARVALDGLVLTFTPDSPLDPNATYTAEVDGVRDIAGNLALGLPFSSTFQTLDTLGPEIASLEIVNGQTPIAGTTIAVQALLAVGETNVTVRFTRDLQPLGTATNEPFRVNLTLPVSGSTIIRAIATDRYNNDGPLAELTINVTSNQPPRIEFVRITPPTNAVPSGSFVAVDVIASDDSAVANLRAIASGALTSDLFGTNSTRLRIQGTVPASASPQQKIEIFAEAVDDTGTSSGEQIFTIDVSDATAPEIALLTPPPGAVIPRISPFELAVRAADNSTNLTLRLELTGGLLSTQVVTRLLVPNEPVTNIFQIPLDGIPFDGQEFLALVEAVDDAGNSTFFTNHFYLPDSEAPAIVSVTPTDGATNVALFPALTLAFSEKVTNVIGTNLVFLGDEPVPGAVFYETTNSTVRWLPLVPLLPDTAYEFRLAETITDLSLNPIEPQSGQFTVTSFQVTRPSTGAPVVEGQSIAATALGMNLDGIRALAFNINGFNPALAPDPFETNVAVPTLAQLAGAPALLAASVLVSNPYTNLLQNPGADEPLQEGEMPGWEEVAGEDWTARLSDPAPQVAPGYFFPGAVAAAELRQDVDVSGFAALIDAGGQAFEFVGYVNSWGDGDRSRVVLEYWSEAMTVILDTWDSGNHNPTSWLELRDLRFAPPGTRTIRVRLISSRNSGSNNDGYYDSLSLAPALYGPLAPIALDVQPAGEDADGDGILNGVEVAIGSDPFTPDSGTDSDGDGLANLDEVQRGTDPGNPDTDGDLLDDGAELALGTDPLNPDSDQDGVPDGIDTSPLNPSGPPSLVVAPTLETVAGVATNLPVQATDSDGNLVRLIVESSLNQVGLLAEFYALGRSIGALADIDFTLPPTHSQTVSRVEFPSEPFWEGGALDQFALRLTGFIAVPQSGEYTFFTASDDGSQLLINGGLVVNNDGLHGYSERSGQVSLAAGYHQFEVRFFENGGGSALRAFWQGPGFARELIPDSAFLAPYFFWENGKPVLPAQAIGGFSSARASELGLDGLRFASFRDLLQTNLPLATIETAASLEPQRLAAWDALILSSAGTTQAAISPLDTQEQTNLLEFVLGGNPLVLLADHSNFAAANQSLLSPFGAAISGADAGDRTVTISDPEHPITSGPSGLFTNYPAAYPGWLDTLPTNALVLGRLTHNGQPALALLPADALAPGSGPVLLASDFGLPPGLILNFFTHAGLPSTVSQINASLAIQPLPPGTNMVTIVAIDADTLSATGEVVVVTLPDADHDGIPDRDDNDLDGDGLSDDAELLAGTDPENPDTDADSVLDGQDLRPLINNAPPFAGLPRPGYGLVFDGIDDYLQVSDRSLINPVTGTIEFWFAATETTNVHHLFYAGAAGDGFGGQDEMHIHLENNRLGWLYFAGGQEQWRVQAGEEIAPGRLYHVAAVWDALANELLLYLDGRLAASGTYRPLSIDTWSHQIRFGRHIGGSEPQRAYAGFMDEIRIWNQPRTHQQVRQGMRRPFSGFEPGLVGYWPLEERLGDRIHNHVAHGPHGTLEGATPPVWTERLDTIVQTAPFLAEQDSPLVIELAGIDLDNDPITAIITSLPAHGRIFQTSDGTTPGAEITETPAEILHPNRRLVYLPEDAFFGADEFEYYLIDAQEPTAPAIAQVHVRSASAPPIAAPDARSGFQDTPLLLDDLLVNDSNPDGPPPRIAGFSSPAHGTVTKNTDGTLTYTPNPGFSGTDAFTYAIADDISWHRATSYTPGPVHGTAQGNPDSDLFGFATWRYEWARGGSLASDSPWYAHPAGLLTWDNSWYGGTGLWSRGNDVHPPLSRFSLTHVLGNTDAWSHIPRVAWISPFDFEADIAGPLTVIWSGNDNVGSPVEVDLVIAHRHASGQVIPLYTNTVSKPTPGDSIGDSVVIPVLLQGVPIQAGDQIIVGHRARNVVDARWINLVDDLTIIPSSASNAAVVTVNVIANNTPVAAAPLPGSALLFDGSRHYLNLGNPPALQITGSQTIEFWLRPANFSERRNPIAKAYAGEGTITIETDGTVNYFYGILGSNSGVGGEDYQSFNTRRALPLWEWTHLALVRDLEAMELRWYLNGELVNETSALFPAAAPGPNTFYIGTGYTRPFAGEMDEVRVWSIARTSTEIAATAFARLTGEETGLAAYWNFDEGSGTMINDSGPAGLNFTMGSNRDIYPAWVASFAPFENAAITPEDTDLLLALTGSDADSESLTTFLTRLPLHGTLYQTSDGFSRGQPLLPHSALAFDGIDDYVLLGSDPALEITNALTISAWIYPLPLPPGASSSIILNKEGEYEIGLLPDGTFWWALANSNPGWTTVPTGVRVPLSKWTHVALVYDGVNGITYVNGNEVHRRSASGTIADSHPAENELRIGARQLGITAFHGQLDEVSLWKTALTPAQIPALVYAPYQLLGDEPDSGLVGYWAFNEADGLAVTDSGAGAFHGTLGGTAAEQPLRVPSAASASAIAPNLVQDPAGLVIFAPHLNQVGMGFLSFLVNDGKVDSAVATLPIRIMPVNDIPTALPDTNMTVQGFAIDTGNLLANDHDVEGQPLGIAEFTQPLNGTIVTNGLGRFLYTPDPAFLGEDSFTYTATDGQGHSLPATVTIHVRPRDQFRWVNLSGGNWSDPANWSQGAVPGPEDAAVIDLAGTYRIAINEDAVVGRFLLDAPGGTQTLALPSRTLEFRQSSYLGTNTVLEISGGTLHGQQILEVAGAFNWTSGRLTGPGRTILLPSASGQFTSASSKLLDSARILENRGALTWTGGTLDLNASSSGGSGRLVIAAGGTLEITHDASLAASGYSDRNAPAPRFVNRGVLLRSGGANFYVDVPFENSGLVQLNSGTLQLRDGAHLSGSIEIASGTTFQPQTATLDGVSLLGEGTVLLNTGTQTLLTDISPSVLHLTGGTIQGPGTITLTNILTWTSGSMRGPGRTIIASGATALLSGGGTKGVDSGRILENHGVIEWSGGDINLNSTSSGGSGRVENMPGGLLRVFHDAQMYASGYNDRNGLPPRFVNSGTIIRETGAGTFYIDVPFEHSGELAIRFGKIRCRDGAFLAGQIELGPDTVLIPETSRFAGAILSGPGTLEFNAGTQTLDSDIAPAHLLLSGGTIRGDASLIITNQMTWTSGTMVGPGRTIVESSGTIHMQEGGTKGLDAGRVLENRGTIEWSGGQLNLNATTTGGSGRLENTATGLVRVLHDANLVAAGYSDENSPPPLLLNAGTISRAQGTGTFHIDVPFEHSGVFAVDIGTVRFRSGGISTGTFLLADGSTLAPESFTFSTNGSFLGSGIFLFDRGTQHFAAPHSLDTLHFTGGTMTGEATLTIAKSLLWTSGRILGNGRTVLAPGSTAQLSGGGNKDLDAQRVLENHGTVTWSGGQLNLNAGTGGGSATIENAADGVFEVTHDASLTASGFSDVNSPPPHFLNAGTLRRNAGTGTFSVVVHLHNTGLLQLDTGSMNLARPGIHAGTFQVAAGSALNFTDGAHTFDAGAIFSGAGSVAISTPVQLLANLDFSTLTVTFAGSASVSGEFLVSNSAGGLFRVQRNLTIPGSLTVEGSLEVANSSHTLNVTGLLTLAPGGSIFNAGTINAGQFINGGTVEGNPVNDQSLQLLSIQRILLGHNAATGLQSSGIAAGEVIIVWRSTPGQSFSIESSADLEAWHQEPARVIEEAPGQYRGVLPSAPGPKFFRLRQGRW